LLGKKSPIDKVNTVIGAGTKLEGKINTKNSIRIDGELYGEINVEGHVVIGKTGFVQGDIYSTSLTIEGTSEGNVYITESIHLASTCHLTGDINAGSIEMEQGAIFNGKSCMIPKVTKEKVAKIETAQA